MLMAKRIITAGAALIMVTALLAGCGKDEAKNAQSPSASTKAEAESATPAAEKVKLDEVTLKIVMPGDPQPDQDTVVKAIEEASKDELNIKLSYSYIPWSDYNNKIKLLAATGEGADIFWTHPELLSQMVNTNALAPLDEAIAKVGQDLTANIPAEYWPVVKVKGQTFAVPAAALGTGAGYTNTIIRKDLREKYGLPEIKTRADLDAFFAAVKINNPEMIPYSINPASSNVNDGFSFGTYFTRGLPPGVLIDMKSLKAMNIFDVPEWKTAYDITRDYYQKGYITKDILSVKDFRALFNSGKAASMSGDVYEFNNASKAISALEGASVEFVRILNAPEPFQEVTTWNFQSVSAGSKNVERAVMFLNWVQKNQENYDLMTLGVEGKHYVKQGDAVGYPDGVDASKPPYNPYEWVWQNPKFMKERLSDTPGFLEMLKNNDADVKLRFAGMGFGFDSSAVKTEVATLNSVSGDYAPIINSGTVDVPTVLPKFKEKMEQAGLDKVTQEVQKQLDAFMATLQ